MKSETRVSFDYKIFYISAYIHLFFASILFFGLSFVLAGATYYAYGNVPKQFKEYTMNDEVTDPFRNALKQEMGGYSLIPFFVVSLISVIVPFWKHKYWYAIWAILAAGLGVLVLCYNMMCLMFLKMSYVWPPQMIQPLLNAPPLPSEMEPFEDFFAYFTKTFLIAFTIAMFAVAFILFYFAFILINLSFFYRPPVQKAIVRQKTVVVEEEQTGTDTEGGENEQTGTGTGTGTEVDEEKKKSPAARSPA